ncbi:hypothetical protein P280DRAFT_479121 [Massarina eburnea CBS 473.64]|uniref:Clr5 domain-containing protein n=1 Tax=Massarina eburnea CBS 473.64 TaxID=1395130 RepID=A0A6A6S3H2_9PLEO|nr:hypothetical protein P280DRAFT_479121 [Massarina eburnea CBS 473.64]
MALPILVPRPGRLDLSPAKEPQRVLTQDEWAAMYSELERLYVRERRRLRYIVLHMAKTYGLKATEQMYKKRFAKWGFHKNNRRQAPALISSSLPKEPNLSPHDYQALSIFNNVQKWSISFFESLALQVPLPSHPWPEKIIKISYTFKLVTDLLCRGRGDLAGRMARKAFLLVEDLLKLEGPALVWNLLELMHYILTLQHGQLFQLLLTHVTALTSEWKPKNHPLQAVLRGLLSLTRILTISDARSLPHLLEKVWVLNAEILFDRFDPRFFQLYFGIHWDSCSLRPPATIVSAANKWFSHIKAKHICTADVESDKSEVHLEDILAQEDRMLRSLLAPCIEKLPPRNYKILCTSNITALRDYGDAIAGKGCNFKGDTAPLLRILACLVKVKVIDERAALAESDTDNEAMRMPRVHAGNVACAIRTSMDLRPQDGSDASMPLSKVVEQNRSIVALREYAHGETDPRVLRDMWRLEEALVAAGKRGDALRVKNMALYRLSQYIQDIPMDSA